MNSSSNKVQSSSLASDVLSGLCQNPKRLPSKYFYDEEGDKLFQKIMHMPEYYLTNAEHDIMEKHRSSILQTIGHQSFDLVELGAGDGYKTKVLLQYLLDQNIDVRYCPIDISGHVLIELENSLKSEFPALTFHCLEGDYFDMLEHLRIRSNTPKVILFMGANIGNMTPEEAQGFLHRIQENMNSGDFLLVGFDLKKDPQLILDAYNDSAGITAAFNLNLLYRINRELGANFNVSQFKHWETYNPQTGATRSYLISKVDQEVYFPTLKKTIFFAAWEAIDVELSQKYSLCEIQSLTQKAGLKIVKHLHDQKKYFVDSILTKS